MSAPTADRVTELARFWESVSIHEAGHTVVGIVLGLPVHHVQLDYQRVGLTRWEVTGWTAIGPGGRGADIEEDDDVLFSFAGLEAEALWISAVDNVPLHQAQAEVSSRQANRSDLDSIAASLPDSGLTQDEGRAQAQDLVLQHWEAIETVATALRDHHYLRRADLARLI